MSNEEANSEENEGVNGLDLIIDGWFHERGALWPGQAMSISVKKVLYHARSKFQDILVLESETYGNVLVLDGVIQVTERDEFSYQEMMAHVPLFAHPDPQRVLVIGGGDGGVLREILKHDQVREVVLCEIDGDVIDVSKTFLPGLAVGYEDPRVSVRVMDGNFFLKEHPNTYDVIITDSSDPVGPASVLFETPFYRAMFASLHTGGIVCTQGECMWLHADIIKPLMDSIATFYSKVEYAYTCIPTYPSGQIGMILARKGDNTSAKVPLRLPTQQQLNTFKYYTPQLHQASFVLPAFAMRTILGQDP